MSAALKPRCYKYDVEWRVRQTCAGPFVGQEIGFYNLICHDVKIFEYFGGKNSP
jgi:hypothetical protein